MYPATVVRFLLGVVEGGMFPPIYRVCLKRSNEMEENTDDDVPAKNAGHLARAAG
ncbi:hypothetical protein [Sporomusa sp.]|uniref:hypothetical protein n=1 Tax=Sporomusa sp. TaxID=2078658 RepID=UPI002B934B4A|nr:hypothetical protein [Sporomusa sp.]HWR43389.1 hypothetical protein [Sporomusa sp.]